MTAWRKAAFGPLLLLFLTSPSFGEEADSRLKALEDRLTGQEQTINEQREMIEELKTKVQQMQSATQPGGAAAVQAAPSGEIRQQVQELKDKVDQVVEAQRKVLPSEFNPSIGLVGETIFSYNNKGSAQTGSSRPGGFDVFQRSVELNAAASVDPFAKAYVVINGSADATTGESSLEVEVAGYRRSRCHGI